MEKKLVRPEDYIDIIAIEDEGRRMAWEGENTAELPFSSKNATAHRRETPRGAFSPRIFQNFIVLHTGLVTMPFRAQSEKDFLPCAPHISGANTSYPLRIGPRSRPTVFQYLASSWPRRSRDEIGKKKERKRKKRENRVSIAERVRRRGRRGFSVSLRVSPRADRSRFSSLDFGLANMYIYCISPFFPGAGTRIVIRQNCESGRRINSRGKYAHNLQQPSGVDQLCSSTD